MRKTAVLIAMAVVSLAGCSRYQQAKQAAEQAKAVSQQVKQAAADAQNGDVQKMMRDQQAAMQARAQAEVPQPPADSPDVALSRKDPGTPEVSSFIPKFVITGQTIDVTLTGADFRATDSISSTGICHVKDAKVNSSKQIKFNVTVDDVLEGKCGIRITSAPNRYIERDLEVQLNPAGTEKATAKMKQQMDDFQAHVADVVGKRWEVKFPSGKSETWTMVEPGMMGITEFKSSTGDKFSIMLGKDDTAMIQLDNCMLQGKIEGGKVSNGQSVLPGCPRGGTWTASISK